MPMLPTSPPRYPRSHVYFSKMILDIVLFIKELASHDALLEYRPATESNHHAYWTYVHWLLQPLRQGMGDCSLD